MHVTAWFTELLHTRYAEFVEGVVVVGTGCIVGFGLAGHELGVVAWLQLLHAQQ